MIQRIKEQTLRWQDNFKTEKDARVWEIAFIGYLCSLIRELGITDAQFGNIGGLKNRTVRYFDVPFPQIVLIDTEGDAFAMEEEEVSSILESQSLPGNRRKVLTLARASHLGLLRFKKELIENGFHEDVIRIVTEEIEKAEKEVLADTGDIAAKILAKGVKKEGLWETFRSTMGRHSGWGRRREEKKEE